jgi:dsDNA-binding SOS-regulon protein
VYNDDYSNKERVDMYSIGKNGNPDIAFCQKIEADALVKAYEKDQLKGRLKEIAANLDDEDNAVIMLVKHKK